MIMKKIKKGIYKHFKGNEYEVLGLAKDSETLEDLVIYRALYGEYGLWVRPLKMFEEEIDKDGETIKRFTLIKEEYSNKVAIPFNEKNNEINYLFEESYLFKIYELTNVKNIINEYIINTKDEDSLLCLIKNDVKVLITNTINEESYDKGRKLGLGIIAGISGKIENIIQDYLDEKLICDKLNILKNKEH